VAENCRFAFAVHVLSVLALHPDDLMNSEALAHSVNTNPVVIRRLLGELVDAGLVETQRGPGGGSRLTRSPQQISLAQIYQSVVGEIEPFGEHPQQPAQCCTVGRGIKRALETVAERARRAVEREYEAISLADVVREVQTTPA
jgi:Rrf2 family protein